MLTQELQALLLICSLLWGSSACLVCISFPPAILCLPFLGHSGNWRPLCISEARGAAGVISSLPLAPQQPPPGLPPLSPASTSVEIFHPGWPLAVPKR